MSNPMNCKHPDLIVQRNYGHRWVTCTECNTDFTTTYEPDATAELSDTKKYTDSMLIAELRRRGSLHVIDRKTNAFNDGLEKLEKYGTGWLTVDEVFV